jgi:uncharacterized protein involved in exopolysaccharide biosynthesis
MNNYLIQKRELASILFRERRSVMQVFFGCFFFMIALSFIVPAKYEADAKLLIKSGREFESRPDPGQSPGIQPYLTKQEVMNSELEILTSNDLIQETINRVGLDRLYPNLDKEDPNDQDKAIKKFGKALKVDSALMSEVIDLSYLNKDRDVATQALNTLIQIYQERHSTFFTDKRSTFLEKKYKDYTTKLDAVTAKIADLRSAKRLFDVPTQQVQLIQDRSLIGETLRNLQTRALDEHGRMHYYGEQLKAVSPFVTDSDDVEALRDWKTRDPAYVDPLYDDALMKLQTAEADASALDAQIKLQQKNLDAIDARLVEMQQGSKTLEDLSREHDALQDVVRTSRSAYEQALTSEELDRQKIVSIDVFAKPYASFEPARPRHLLYALIGFLFGAFGACLIVAYHAIFRQSFVNAESVERILGIRVLATLPERA